MTDILDEINGVRLIYLGCDPKTKIHSYLARFPGSILIYRRSKSEERKHQKAIAAIEHIKSICEIPQVFQKYLKWTRLVDVPIAVYKKIEEKFELEQNVDTLEFKIIGRKTNESE